MPEIPHIIVIGGGLIGLSCADQLLAGGARVTVIEKGMSVGLGAGEYNSGMIHPSQALSWFKNDNLEAAKKVLELALGSVSLLQKRRGELGCRDISRPDGTLQLFDSQYAGQQAQKTYEKLCIPVERYIGSHSYQRFGLHFPEDKSGDAHLYMQALEQDMRARGCTFILGQNAWPQIERNLCVGAGFGDDTIKGDAVIVAAGAQSVSILQRLGINLPVVSVPGHAIIYDRPHYGFLPEKPIMHWDTRSAFTVFEDHVRLSGTVGETYPDALVEIWEEIMPEVMSALGAPILNWSADRPVSKLGRPFIAETNAAGLWVNTGHGHMGWTLCAGSGALMADMILDGRQAPEFNLPTKV